ncbi:hypothetical protein P8452_21896 [Trifolium repens]|nr:hypothetical protein P8452_21896 [Trifolium repens]
MLNQDPKLKSTPLKKKNSYPKEVSRTTMLPSASLRTQHRLAQALSNKARKTQSLQSNSNVRPTFSDEATGPVHEESISIGVTRNPPSKLGKNTSTSISSAGLAGLVRKAAEIGRFKGFQEFQWVPILEEERLGNRWWKQCPIS